MNIKAANTVTKKITSASEIFIFHPLPKKAMPSTTRTNRPSKYHFQYFII